jgi:hypothetical protein
VPVPRFPLLLLPALLAGCGDLPRPFAGHPGATALRLAQPPPARLAVPVPSAALLPDAAGAALASALAAALQARDVPAVAEAPRDGDWRLLTSAEVHGAEVVPVFTEQNPKGEDKGAAQGPGVPSALWAEGAPETMQHVAEAAAPTIAALLTSVEAARRQTDPTSLVNRPARVFFKGVHGAPGDGDAALARQLRKLLPDLGLVVQDAAAGADFAVTCTVATRPAADNNLQVEIEWQVDDATGRDAGRVSQVHDVPAAIVNGYWGDVAVAAAQEAAGGIHEVILNQSGARQKAPPPAAPPPQPTAGVAAAAAVPAAAAAASVAAAAVAKPSCASWTPPPHVARSRPPPSREACDSGSRTAPDQRQLGPIAGNGADEDRRLQQQSPARRGGGRLAEPATDTRVGAAVRGHGSVRGDPREHPRRGRVRDPVDVVSGERQPDGTADHAGRAAAGLGAAGDGGHPVFRVRKAGPQVRAAHADQRQAGGEPDH